MKICEIDIIIRSDRYNRKSAVIEDININFHLFLSCNGILNTVTISGVDEL